jgi:hypothetical protein
VALLLAILLVAWPEVPPGDAPASRQEPPPTAEPAEEGPASPDLPAPPPAEGEARHGRGRQPGEDSWIDITHEFVETRLFAPVLGFDRFFADERELEEERARSFLRWRSELRVDVEQRPAFATGLRANLRLPGLNKVMRRVRVVIAGGTRDTLAAALPEDPSPEGRTPGDAELRFALLDVLGAHADLGAGLLFQLPVGYFARAGLRFRLVAGDLFVARLSISGFWRTDTRLGSRADARLERPVASSVLLRLGNEVLLTQVSRGVEWTPSVTALVGLGRRTAASLGVGALWTSEGQPRLDRYRLGLRLRRAAFRSWLFLELEPEVYWPWSPERGRHRAWATTARVEIQFHGNERPSTPGDPRPADEAPVDDPP